jgi:hypothetical protein
VAARPIDAESRTPEMDANRECRMPSAHDSRPAATSAQQKPLLTFGDNRI